VTDMRIRSDIDYLNFARVGGFHILINFHARFRYQLRPLNAVF
jgi:hypothetical protein